MRPGFGNGWPATLRAVLHRNLCWDPEPGKLALVEQVAKAKLAIADQLSAAVPFHNLLQYIKSRQSLGA